MNYERLYKLYKLGNQLTDEQLTPIVWFENYCSKLILKQEGEWIKFYLDDEFVMVQKSESDDFFVDRDNIWVIFKSIFSMERVDIQLLIKSVVESTFKIKLNTNISWF